MTYLGYTIYVGSDGCSSFTKYQFKRKWHPPMALQSPSMFASTASIIQLVALLPNNEVVVLFDNEAVNSCFGTIPLKYSWESESYLTSKDEWVRLRIQASQIRSYIELFEGVDLEVDFMGWPCLSDSKTKVYWSGRKAMMNCYVCDATPTELAHRHCPKFKNPRRSAYIFGLGPLHIRLRFVDWVVKYITHIDCKKRDARYYKKEILS